ncbi:rhodanese-like domain-containing protein [Psychroserpens damuponensis]|uniref:rhodanese-like domain-containing protein n=1 Tax=Psychroserpens damuponensis TaxID=943936 RepID=UPI00126A08F1|nr:rhodanese-like domain-containing protein [Psychroserpens damuponensis]
MKATLIVTFMTFLMCSSSETQKLDFPKAKVSYSDFEDLVKVVKDYRAERLISFDEFLEKSKDPNVIILDTRSKVMYDKKHVKGALHLNFSDFSVSNLDKIIPDTDTTILIYCNNNFNGDEVHFMSKTLVIPPSEEEKERTLSLALNIPTYINLYGYGYKNVYELDELISFLDQRIVYEGSTVNQEYTTINNK